MIPLSIVIPCYNEERNLPLLLERCKAIYRPGAFELVLVDNGSTDGTPLLLRVLDRRLYPFLRTVRIDQNIGYGHGIVTGLRAAAGQVLAWTHADLQTDVMDVLNGYEVFLGQPDPDRVVVKGYRTKRPLGAWLFTLGMSLIASVILQGLLYDINAQPKLFSRRFFEREFKDAPNDFSLDTYLLATARRKHYSIVTFPVTFKQRLYGESKWAATFPSRWSTVLRTIRYIIRLRATLP